MKKLLMCSAAVALGLAVAHPAKADGIKLDLAGHFMGYVTWVSHDSLPSGTTQQIRAISTSCGKPKSTSPAKPRWTTA